ncbi:hypothetical protein BB558_003038 [Smittium angustum]|uniref:Ras-GEF domain-containing protein n=1 Tax=Smittium angustum TaxID=133377 RepID=A0A2U1J753_SMIAN|nr:hypothetical protein BB558_003038 [Smittium angustum]
MFSIPKLSIFPRKGPPNSPEPNLPQNTPYSDSYETDLGESLLFGHRIIDIHNIDVLSTPALSDIDISHFEDLKLSNNSSDSLEKNPDPSPKIPHLNSNHPQPASDPQKSPIPSSSSIPQYWLEKQTLSGDTYYCNIITDVVVFKREDIHKHENPTFEFNNAIGYSRIKEKGYVSLNPKPKRLFLNAILMRLKRIENRKMSISWRKKSSENLKKQSNTVAEISILLNKTSQTSPQSNTLPNNSRSSPKNDTFVSWEMLTASVAIATHRLISAIDEKNKFIYIRLAENIADSARLAISHAKDPTKEKSHATLIRSQYRQVTNSGCDLLLSAAVASSIWPPPDSGEKLKTSAQNLLSIVRKLIADAEKNGLILDKPEEIISESQISKPPNRNKNPNTPNNGTTNSSVSPKRMYSTHRVSGINFFKGLSNSKSLEDFRSPVSQTTILNTPNTKLNSEQEAARQRLKKHLFEHQSDQYPNNPKSIFETKRLHFLDPKSQNPNSPSTAYPSDTKAPKNLQDNQNEAENIIYYILLTVSKIDNESYKLAKDLLLIERILKKIEKIHSKAYSGFSNDYESISINSTTNNGSINSSYSMLNGKSQTSSETSLSQIENEIIVLAYKCKNFISRIGIFLQEINQVENILQFCGVGDHLLTLVEILNEVKTPSASLKNNKKTNLGLNNSFTSNGYQDLDVGESPLTKLQKSQSLVANYSTMILLTIQDMLFMFPQMSYYNNVINNMSKSQKKKQNRDPLDNSNNFNLLPVDPPFNKLQEFNFGIKNIDKSSSIIYTNVPITIGSRTSSTKFPSSSENTVTPSISQKSSTYFNNLELIQNKLDSTNNHGTRFTYSNSFENGKHETQKDTSKSQDTYTHDELYGLREQDPNNMNLIYLISKHNENAPLDLNLQIKLLKANLENFSLKMTSLRGFLDDLDEACLNLFLTTKKALDICNSKIIVVLFSYLSQGRLLPLQSLHLPKRQSNVDFLSSKYNTNHKALKGKSIPIIPKYNDDATKQLLQHSKSSSESTQKGARQPLSQLKSKSKTLKNFNQIPSNELQKRLETSTAKTSTRRLKKVSSIKEFLNIRSSSVTSGSQGTLPMPQGRNIEFGSYDQMKNSENIEVAGIKDLTDFTKLDSRRKTKTYDGSKIVRKISENLLRKHSSFSKQPDTVILSPSNSFRNERVFDKDTLDKEVKYLEAYKNNEQENKEHNLKSIMKHQPWFLQYDYSPEDLILTPGGEVKAGTLAAMVERLTAHDVLNTQFVSSFLLTYRAFTTSPRLFALLFERYEISIPVDLRPNEIQIWNENKLEPIRIRVFNILKNWLREHFYPNIDGDMDTLEMLRVFACTTMADAQPMMAEQLLKLVDKHMIQVKKHYGLQTNQESPPESISFLSSNGSDIGIKGTSVPIENGSTVGNIASSEKSLFPSKPPSILPSISQSSSVLGSLENRASFSSTVSVSNGINPSMYSPINFTTSHLRKLVTNHSTPPPSPILPIVSLNSASALLKINPIELARQITLIDFSLFSKVRPCEFLKTAWSISPSDPKAVNGLTTEIAVNLRSISALSTKVTHLVMAMVLKEKNLTSRVKYILYFISLGEQLWVLKNFNGLVSVLGGLESSPIQSLESTWKLVGQKALESFEFLKNFMSTTKNYQNYRETQMNMAPPAIPFIGLTLTDLTFIEDGNPDYYMDSKTMVNFAKYSRIADIIKPIQQFQLIPYSLLQVNEIINFFFNCIKFVIPQASSEDNLMDLFITMSSSIQNNS